MNDPWTSLASIFGVISLSIESKMPRMAFEYLIPRLKTRFLSLDSLELRPLKMSEFATKSPYGVLLTRVKPFSESVLEIERLVSAP